MRKLKPIVAFTVALVVFLTVSWATAWLLMPKRTEYGSTWDQYLREDAESIDILFFGSSLSYCDIIPAGIYTETGLRSYVMAGPEQTVPIMYYYVKETCKTQKPQLVAAEVTNVFYRQYQNYTKANISYMPFGQNRIGATIAGAEKEEWFGLFFPLYNYHYRWTSVDTSDIQWYTSPPDDMTAGYTLLTESCEPPASFMLKYSSNTDNYRRNIDYLAKLKNFCDSEDIELMLYITPSCGKIPAAELNTLRSDLNSIGVNLRDFNENLDELGIDDNLDWYDPLHFNLRGAEKFTRFLANELTSSYTLSVTENSSELWQKRVEYISKSIENLEQ